MNTEPNEELTKKVTILTGDPTIAVIAEMELNESGIDEMVGWVGQHRPECLPDVADTGMDESFPFARVRALFPHALSEPSPAPLRSMRTLTANELLVELAGRTCYHSYGLKAGKKTNKEYIAHTQAGEVKHASVLYHAKMSFFFGGISRRVSHEIIRNYVGADRDEEGSPSQESTRFTHHYGFFIMPPRYLECAGNSFGMRERFECAMQDAYDNYLGAVNSEVAYFKELQGRVPTAIDRKRIYEAASSFLPHQSETSFIWTSNPMAIAKFCKERDNEAADLEIQRFAKKWKKICVERWPNVFPQPWMQE